MHPSPASTPTSGSLTPCDSPISRLPLTDPTYGGYHFNESFLVTPCLEGASPEIPDISSTSTSPKGYADLRSHPTRTVTPVLWTPLTPSISKSATHKDWSKLSLPPSPNDRRTQDRPSKRSRLTPPLLHASVQRKPRQSRYQGAEDQDEELSQPCPLETYTPETINIVHAPTLHFYRATWWECLLSTYTLRPDTSQAAIPLHKATTEISQDVYAFFKAAPFLLSFLNVPLFFDNFYHPERRAEIQPALVLSILAYAKMLQSNYDATRSQSLEERELAWGQSVVLRDLAQSSFEASYNAGWIDLSLAQAAWVSEYLILLTRL